MAAPTTQIGTVTVPALVTTLNGVLFTNGVNGYNGDEVIGKVIPVPCRDILYDNTDRWGVPVKDAGIFTGIDYVYKRGIYAVNPPTVDSFPAFRIYDTKSTYEWFIYGTKADLIASCSTCCDDNTIEMPGTDPQFSLRIAPCQIVDLTNTNGNPYMVFGVPTLDATYNYYPYGTYNNVNFPSASATGYANTTLLLAFLNANFTPYVWTLSTDNLTLTATGGSIGDSLCVNIIQISESP